MNIFEEVKSCVTAKDVAVHYGLNVKRNNMACCPFHNDHNPSMSIKEYYHCFACGAHGDAINYVSEMFGLRPYDAACKIIEDFSLPIAVKVLSPEELKIAKIQYEKALREKKRQAEQRERFRKWCNEKIESLKDAEDVIEAVENSIVAQCGVNAMNSNDFATVICMKSTIEYWLDILCFGTMEDKLEFLVHGRKEVENRVRELFEIGARYMAGGSADTGRGICQCG